MPVLPASHAAGNTVHYKIGVLANRGKEQCLKQWQHTALDLQDKIPGTSFTIVPLNYGETEAVVKNRTIDFIITNAGIYVDLEVRYGAQRIATMKDIYFDRVVTESGGVIFTRADRKDISRLEDLKHKTFIAVDKDSFGGWLAAWRELQDHDIHPAHDLRELKFGGTLDNVVHAVQKGEFDAGTVRTDILEQMAAEGKIRLRDFKVLHTLRDNYPEFPFLLSTRLYPEWPFAQLQHTPLEITEQVCMALLSIQRDDIAAVAGHYAGWTTPLNYQSVHECLKELRYKPYENFGRITFRDVLKKYWLIILAIAILIGIMAVIINYIVALNRKLKQSQLVIQREQEELRLSEHKIRSIIEESVEGIMLSDEQGSIIEWNRSLEQISGMRHSEVIGKPIWDIQYQMVLPEKRTQAAYEQLKGKFQVLLNIGKSPMEGQPVDSEMMRPDGTRAITQSLVVPIRTAQGFMVAGFAFDITERKQVEQKLLETKNYLDNIINSSLDAIVASDMAARITQCNQAFLDLTGHTEDEVIGKSMYELTQPIGGETYESSTGEIIQVNEGYYNESIKQISQLLETGKVANWEAFYLRKDNKVVPVEQSIFFLTDKGGNRIGSASIIRDITERKKTEKELMETKDYLENIIKSSWDAIVIGDNTGRLAKCNRYFLTLLGYTEDEVIGRNMYEFSPTADGLYESSDGGTVTIDEAFFKQGRDSITSLFENGNIANWQTYLISKSKKLIPVEENIVILFDNTGNRIGSVGTLRDITERRRIENERERLIAELQEALAQVKTLGGMLPICASCKKIRNDQGYWEQVEGYISTRSEAEFTHSICPDCVRKLYPEIYAEIGKDKK